MSETVPETETVAEMLASTERVHEVDDGTRSISRRTLVATTVGAAAGAFVLLPASGPARAEVSAEKLTAEGDEITSHDGSVDSITVDPVIAITWEGFDDGFTDANVEIAFDTADESKIVVYEETETLEGTHGEETFDYGVRDLLVDGWSAATFEAEESGSEESTAVTVTVTLEVPAKELTASADESFTVTVENHPSNIGGPGGNVPVSLQSDEEV